MTNIDALLNNDSQLRELAVRLLQDLNIPFESDEKYKENFELFYKDLQSELWIYFKKREKESSHTIAKNIAQDIFNNILKINPSDSENIVNLISLFIENVSNNSQQQYQELSFEEEVKLRNHSIEQLEEKIKGIEKNFNNLQNKEITNQEVNLNYLDFTKLLESSENIDKKIEEKKKTNQIEELNRTLEEYKNKDDDYYHCSVKQLENLETEIANKKSIVKKNQTTLENKQKNKQGLDNLGKPFRAIGYFVATMIFCAIIGGGNPIVGFCILIVISMIYNAIKSLGQ